MNIAIATNGSLNIGYGHIARSLVVAEEFLAKGHRVSFLVNKDCPFIERIEQANVLIYTVNYESPDKVSNILVKDTIDILIIDCVEEIYDNLSVLNVGNTFIVTITLFPFAKEKRYEHLSFFPSVHPFKKEITSFGTKIYSGRDFLIFNKVFKNYSNKSFNDKAKNVLITAGGSDPSHITWKVFNAMKRLTTYSFTIILSKLNPHYKEIEAAVDKMENFVLINYSSNIAELMNNSDVVILNGGLTRYEACITRTPFIAIAIHQTQYSITEELTKYGVGINLGIIDQLSETQIETSILGLMEDNKLRSSMYQKARNLFDTNGAKRLYETIVKEFYEETK